MLIDPSAMPELGRLVGSTAPENVNVIVELMNTPCGHTGGGVGLPLMFCQSGVGTPWAVMRLITAVWVVPPPPLPPPPHPERTTAAPTNRASTRPLLLLSNLMK